jgi:1,4-alpha-glucan branching enzyme
LPGEASLKADKVTVVGDFNNWEKEATPLEKQKNGDFTTILELDAGKEYRFRYLIDGQRWENDWNADKYVKSLYDVEDSVVCA